MLTVAQGSRVKAQAAKANARERANDDLGAARRVGQAGNLFKFDFDFGAHGASATVDSPILGPLTKKRCRGPGLGPLSSPAYESPFTCSDAKGKAVAALTGSLIFSQVSSGRARLASWIAPLRYLCARFRALYAPSACEAGND